MRMGYPNPLETPIERHLDTIMSNFDHSIDESAELALRANPGRVAGHHAAWDFSGDVWFDGENFCEAVNRYHVLQEIIKAPTLRELMTAVNDKYGSD